MGSRAVLALIGWSAMTVAVACTANDASRAPGSDELEAGTSPITDEEPEPLDANVPVPSRDASADSPPDAGALMLDGGDRWTVPYDAGREPELDAGQVGDAGDTSDAGDAATNVGPLLCPDPGLPNWCAAGASGGACTNLHSDDENCGTCGNNCGALDMVCASVGSGRFDCACPADRPDRCGDECVNLETDVEHCGTCDTSCSADGPLATCHGGECWANAVGGCGASGSVCPACTRCSDDGDTGVCVANPFANACETGVRIGNDCYTNCGNGEQFAKSGTTQCYNTCSSDRDDKSQCCSTEYRDQLPAYYGRSTGGIPDLITGRCNYGYEPRDGLCYAWCAPGYHPSAAHAFNCDRDDVCLTIDGWHQDGSVCSKTTCTDASVYNRTKLTQEPLDPTCSAQL